MKTILFFLSLLSPVVAQTAFNGRAVEWGWSGKSYSKQDVTDILDQTGEDFDKFALQAMVDKVTQAEFLWKVTADQVSKADNTASSYIVVGTQVSDMVITFDPTGRGEILLYSQGKLSGRVRCWTSSKRTGDKYYQLAEGEYKVLHKNSNGWSHEFECKMPYMIDLDGSAKRRGVKIHVGDIAGPIEGENFYHGCIRVSEPVGKQFMKIIPDGTRIKVIWADKEIRYERTLG
jgi:hypothetical protein